MGPRSSGDTLTFHPCSTPTPPGPDGLPVARSGIPGSGGRHPTAGDRPTKGAGPTLLSRGPNPVESAPLLDRQRTAAPTEHPMPAVWSSAVPADTKIQLSGPRRCPRAPKSSLLVPGGGRRRQKSSRLASGGARGRQDPAVGCPAEPADTKILRFDPSRTRGGLKRHLSAVLRPSAPPLPGPGRRGMAARSGSAASMGG